MMQPVISRQLVALIVLVGLNGCAQISIEDQAIQRFTTALQSKDMGDIRSMTSETFQEKALRHTESLDDLKILRLPKDAPAVAKVEDVSPTEKNVTVATEGSSRRLLYRLVLTDGQWVVDDIYMKQKQKGLKVTRSVTEQMDLLLSVREFLTVWNDGDRRDVLKMTTPDFGSILRELPTATLVHLTSQVAAGRSDRTAFRPEAQLDNDRAVVKLPRTNGELLISFELQNEQWKVDDVGVQSAAKDSPKATIRRQAEILLAGAKFLDAYQNSDKDALSQLCTPKFHRGALLPSDLTLQPLPDGNCLDADHEIRSREQHASIIVPHHDDLLKIDLVREEQLDDPTVPGAYQVDDVTLFQTDGSQQRRLSSVFTSRARLLIFHDALQRGDLTLMRRMATNDFNERVWNHVDDQLFQQLPMESARTEFADIKSSEFLGAVTKLTTQTAEGTVVWVLKEANGQMTVDDIVSASETAPDSVKERFEVLVPAIRFVMDLQGGKTNQLAKVCSRDFNRLVWKHTQTVPNVDVPVSQLLTSPLARVDRRAARANIVLGNQQWGARLNMIEELGHWVIDEVDLITGLDTANRKQLKHAFRHQLAVNSRRSSKSRSGSGSATAQLPDVKPAYPSREPQPTTRTAQVAAATPKLRTPPTASGDSGVVPATFEFETEETEPLSTGIDRVVDPSENPIAIPFE